MLARYTREQIKAAAQRMVADMRLDRIIAAANQIEHSPCWGCGAWLMTPHTPWCRVARGTLDRYMEKRA